MFVYLPPWGRHGVAAATVGVLATLGACTDPAQKTDLRPEGPPEVLAILVMDDAAGQLAETATFCKKDDDKRPGLVGLPNGSTRQICPDLVNGKGDEVSDAVHDAYPQGWYVRVMFDELLDPNIEHLTEILDDNGQGTGTFSGSIAATHPVKLKCTGLSGAMVDVPYDGYYSPSGNSVTWPVGPSLVVKPNLPGTIPTNSHCQIELNANILDKDGNPVPPEQRVDGANGPYTFSVAPISVASIAPADQAKLDGVDAGMDVVFNTLIDPTSIDDAADWSFTPGLGTSPAIGNLAAPILATDLTFQVDEDSFPTGVPLGGYYDQGEPGCTPDAACSIAATACTTDLDCPPTETCDPLGTATCDTLVVIDSESIHLTAIDYTTTPYTWTVTRGADATTAAAHTADTVVYVPVTNTFSDGSTANGGVAEPASGLFPTVGGKLLGASEWFVAGDFKANTGYTWTLPQGTKLKDQCGVETTFVDPPSVDAFTQVQFTVNDLLFTGITPTDGTMASSPATKIQLKFNQPMNPNSLAGRCSVTTTIGCFSDADCGAEICVGTGFTLSPTVAHLAVIQDLADASKLDLYGDYQLGTQYTFTLSAGTRIAECPGAETLYAAAIGGPRGVDLNGCDLNGVAEYINASDQTTTFKTAATLALLATSPKDNTVITKTEPIGPQSRTSITLTFNQEMDPATLTAADYTIDPPVALETTASPADLRSIRLRPTAGCTATSATCAGFAPSDYYTFTLKAGAQISDYLGNLYTQPTDLVIHFAIKDPDPAPDCLP